METLITALFLVLAAAWADSASLETPEVPEAAFDVCSQPIQLADTASSANGNASSCFYFDTEKSECVEFQAEKCGPKAKNFPTLEVCADTCTKTRSARRVPQDISYKMLSDFEWSAPSIGTNVARRRFPIAFCDLERDMGILCVGIRRGSYLEQFYYDAKTNRCNSFIYNGCAGNANRFASIWECTQSCVRKSRQHF